MAVERRTPRRACATPDCENCVEFGHEVACLACAAKVDHYSSQRYNAFRKQDQGERPRLNNCPQCDYEDRNLVLSLNHCPQCGW